MAGKINLYAVAKREEFDSAHWDMRLWDKAQMTLFAVRLRSTNMIYDPGFDSIPIGSYTFEWLSPREPKKSVKFLHSESISLTKLFQRIN